MKAYWPYGQLQNPPASLAHGKHWVDMGKTIVQREMEK